VRLYGFDDEEEMSDIHSDSIMHYFMSFRSISSSNPVEGTEGSSNAP